MANENPTAAANAVTPNILPLHELTLIGLMYADGASTALIRTSQGQIAKVRPGDIIGAQTVAAISENGLILAGTNGSQTILKMPS